MNNRKMAFTSAVVLLFLAMQVACAASSSLQVSNPELTAREFTGELNIKSSMAILTGVARNTRDTTARNCVITVIFYDENKNNLGTACASRESLGPGESWYFKVQLDGTDAWKARTYGISTSNQ